MARMRRINVVIDPELDDRLEREAALRRVSKSALVRECIRHTLPAEHPDNGLLALAELSRLNEHVAPADVDTELYGPVVADA